MKHRLCRQKCSPKQQTQTGIVVWVVVAVSPAEVQVPGCRNFGMFRKSIRDLLCLHDDADVPSMAVQVDWHVSHSILFWIELVERGEPRCDTYRHVERRVWET